MCIHKSRKLKTQAWNETFIIPWMSQIEFIVHEIWMIYWCTDADICLKLKHFFNASKFSNFSAFEGQMSVYWDGLDFKSVRKLFQ